MAIWLKMTEISVKTQWDCPIYPSYIVLGVLVILNIEWCHQLPLEIAGMEKTAFSENPRILTFSANLAAKKTQEDLDFLEWPPKPIHSVPVPKRKKMYWFWWSTDHFYFPLSFFYENLDFFYEWWNWTVENHKWCYNFATKWPVVGLNGWKPCSNLAEVENNQKRLLLTSPRAKLELLHSILAKNLNFPEKIVIFRKTHLGPMCDPSR